MRALRRSTPAALVTMVAVLSMCLAGGYGGGGGSSISTPVSVANGGTGLASGTSGGVPYYSGSTTIASSGALAANSLVKGGGAGVAPSTITTGTGILTALGVNVGSAGAPVVFNGALGTPSSGTLTSCTGLPINTGLIIASEAQGDILYRGASAWSRLAAGTSGYVLTSGGAGANPAWAAASGADFRNVTGVTTNNSSITAAANTFYPVTLNDQTITLPAAASNTNKTISFRVVGISGAKICTLDGNASETIDGATTLVLFALNDRVEIISDGSNWHVIAGRLVPHRARLERAATQAFSDATWTKVAFDAETYDTGEIGDITTNDRVDIRRAGDYRISFRWGNSGSITGGLWAGIRINGNETFATSAFGYAGNFAIVGVTDTYTLAAGDYVEGWVYTQLTVGTPTTGSGLAYRAALSVDEIR